MTGEALIRYVCVAPAHCRSTELGLTRHEGEWALCPDLLGQGHDWSDTGGLGVVEAVAHWQELAGITRARPAA